MLLLFGGISLARKQPIDVSSVTPRLGALTKETQFFIPCCSQRTGISTTLRSFPLPYHRAFLPLSLMAPRHRASRQINKYLVCSVVMTRSTPQRVRIEKLSRFETMYDTKWVQRRAGPAVISQAANAQFEVLAIMEPWNCHNPLPHLRMSSAPGPVFR